MIRREGDGAWLRAMPWLFVLIWSTGFVVARYGMPHAPPLRFLVLRYALSVACFGLWVALARPAWPRERAQWLHQAVAGVLMHAGYLGGVWSAIKAGAGAGIVALLVGLQPVLTALWVAATARGHPGLSARLWLGLALGLAGLALVVAPKLGVGELTPFNLGCTVFALASITAGTLYQKRFVAPCDVRSAPFVQLSAALLATAPFAFFESGAIVRDPELVGALAWSVLVLTLGGSSLLYLLIQRGAATSVASLMYLVPPCTAALAWLLFGERFTPGMMAGFALAVVGVALVVRQPPRPDPNPGASP